MRSNSAIRTGAAALEAISGQAYRTGKTASAPAQPTRPRLRASTWLVAAAASFFAGLAPAQIPLAFDLSEATSTSAGLYDAEGRLVRTLWSNVRYAAGKHTVQWDGKDATGNLVLDALGYKVKVASHNVSYEWEGVVGNSSDEQTWTSRRRKHRAFEAIWDMVFVPNGKGFYVSGYNEGQPLAFQIHQNDYQMAKEMTFSDYRYAYQTTATDNERVYIVNNGGDSPNKFVVAYWANKIKDDWHERYHFTGGESEWLVGKSETHISGLAVQKTGSRLFVAYEGGSAIKVFDKVSGALLGEIPATNVSRMEVDGNDNLWIVQKEGASYSIVEISNLAATPTKTTIVSSGLAKPLAFAFAPANDYFVVADGGASQQLKAYSLAGERLWTHGLEGGYDAHGADVTPDKFMFFTRNDGRYWLERTFVTFSPDGRLWVGDTGNNRTVIFDANMNYSDEIIYFPCFYVSATDHNDPTRVFGSWLEFEVDYSKPLDQGWKLVKNWSAGLTEAKNRTGGPGIADAATLTASGRTRAYAFAQVQGEPHWNSVYVYELPASGGPMRFTGAKIGMDEGINKDGSVRGYKNISDQWQQIYERQLVSIDEQGNPKWGPSEVIATIPRDPARPQYGTAFSSLTGPRVPVTESGKVIVFDPARKAASLKAFHLGAIRRGEKTWDWVASPSGKFPVRWDESNMEIHGDVINPTGAYDDLTAHTYGGNRVLAEGKNIIYGYHGEFWNQGQANQWLHFNEDGLFLGQFGKPTYPWKGGYEGQAGNAFSPTLVKVDNVLYLYHNDESQHAGVHRWSIKGLDTIKTYTINLGIDPRPLLPELATFAAYVEVLGLDAAQVGPQDDPDQDGAPNLLEFIRNTYADEAESPTQCIALAGFEFAAAKLDVVTYQDERAATETWRYSYDGSSWTSIAPEQISATTVDGNGVRRLRFSDLDEGRQIRLKRALSIEGQQIDADTVTFTISGTQRPSAAGATSFDGFVSLFRLPAADRDPTDDPDGDGMSNLLEYIFSTDPGLADEPISALSLAGFEFAAAKIDVVTYEDERAATETWRYSYDGSSWTSIAPEQISATTVDGNGVRRLRFSDLDEGRQIRLKRALSIEGQQIDADTVTFTISGTQRPSAAGATSFDGFVSLFRLPAADRDRADDPDGDGMSNLLEYIFSTDPGLADEPISALSLAGFEFAAVKIDVASDDAERDCDESWLYSYDGAAWSPIAPTELSATNSGSGEVRRLRFANLDEFRPISIKRVLAIGASKTDAESIEFVIAGTDRPNPASAADFASFVSLFRLPANQSGATHDPDGDGQSNLVEFVYNTDPGEYNEPSHSVAIASYGKNSVEVLITQPVAARSFSASWEYSHDGKTWTAIKASSSGNTNDPGARTATFTPLPENKATTLKRRITVGSLVATGAITQFTIASAPTPKPAEATSFADFLDILKVPSSARGAAADPDGDLVPNLVEYLYNLDPGLSTPVSSSVSIVEYAYKSVKLRHVAAVAERPFSEIWEISKDYQTWSPITATVLATESISGAASRTIQFVGLSAGATYMRRSVEAEGHRVATSITSLVVPNEARPDPRDAVNFAAFAELFSLPIGSDGLAHDPDKDGISNAFEYLFHTDPLEPNPEKTQTGAAGVANGKYYLLQIDPIERRSFTEKWLVSCDLITWTVTTPAVLSSNLDATSGTEIRELSFPMPTDSKNCYFRRSVTPQ